MCLLLPLQCGTGARQPKWSLSATAAPCCATCSKKTPGQQMQVGCGLCSVSLLNASQGAGRAIHSNLRHPLPATHAHTGGKGGLGRASVTSTNTATSDKSGLPGAPVRAMLRVHSGLLLLLRRPSARRNPNCKGACSKPSKPAAFADAFSSLVNCASLPPTRRAAGAASGKHQAAGGARVRHWSVF